MSEPRMAEPPMDEPPMDEPPMAIAKARGATFMSKKGKIAPDALKEALLPVKESVKPTAVVAKEMFSTGKKKNVSKVPPKATLIGPPKATLIGPPKATLIGPPKATLIGPPKATLIGPPKATLIGPPKATLIGPPKATLIGPPKATLIGPPKATLIGPPKATLIGPPKATLIGPPKATLAPPKATLAPPKATLAPPRATPAPEETESLQPEPQPELEQKAEPTLAELLEDQEEAPMVALDRLPEEQKEMAILIQKEETRDLYDTQVPATYVPETRRGFADFIKLQYKPYILPSTPITVPEGEKYYPYQKFVRDHMRKEAPYRGILVYHGLGSGKTCTAIAAAEALFATAKKNIIVMSPFSLKKNFLREVSKCGFRHFQLKNFWVALPNPRDPTTTFFANSVLGLSARYLKKARNVWVPDFRKSQAESNYETLSPEDRAEIRQQILSIIEYDPDTNPTGRIRFISYNGISAKKLMRIACDPAEKKFFDDAVIVVDEIHNLIRTIQGNIEPYLVKDKEGISRGKRKIEVEEVTPGRWAPNRMMCDETRTGDFYKRGYLFYRLLLDARNSKIIGLSGTPLINFPEELGILANVLHGYITIVEGLVEQSGSEIQKQAVEVGKKHPFIDFINAKNDSGGTRVVMSLLPAGNIKIGNDVGIARIPAFSETDMYVNMYAAVSDLFEGRQPAMEEVVGAIRGIYSPTEYVPFENIQRGIMGAFTKETPTKKEIIDAIASVYAKSYDMPSILKSIENAFRAAGLAFKGPPTARSEPLLPPFGDDFKQSFVPNGTNIINKATLITRLTGVVSFYKGSSLELMPRVAKDEVVRVPFSDYAQRAYSFKRTTELKKEMEKKPGQTVDAVWAQIYELGDSGAANNYKMGSRQACNFTFPAEVPRPSPTDKKEQEEEAEAGVAPVELVALAADEGKGVAEAAGTELEEFPELNEEADVDAVEAMAVVEEEAPEEAQEEPMEGGGKTIAQLRLEKKDPAAAAAATAAADAAMRAECKAGRKAGEKYTDACQRAKHCLATIAKARMTLGGEDGLANYSGKFAAMLERIRDAPGSSLIYSQFLDMEGIGIFRVAMDVNGYAPIEIVNTGNVLSFTRAAEASLRLGPGKQPRYMTFSGGEDEKVRAAALSIFNAQFSDLPDSMNIILREAGYTDNKVGELCRVFCITSAGAEGLSLRNVRAVHIMEPYWNEVRLKQVKGRAIRIGSHLDLPPDQRDVSIYTYISVFSDDAQGNKVPDKRIDQTLLLHDSVDAKKATDAGIPLKPGATTYVLTTDEMIYTISERKRKIIEALECIMKSSSVDCEINMKKNKDGSFMCLPLKGKVGDFMYNPVLKDDLLDAPQFVGADGKDILEKVCVPGAPPVEMAEDPAANDLFKALKGITYRMRPVMGEDGTVERFDMYEADQVKPAKKIPLKLLGTAGAKDGKPAQPVKML